MGIYVNPGNLAFQRIAGKNYVDKTGLIEKINWRIGGDESLVCVSRPRRFGKSYAAKMLTAFYDCSCDSHALFSGKKIAQTEGYERFLNQFNVICVDISGFTSSAQKKGSSLQSIPIAIEDAIHQELRELDPCWRKDDELEASLIRCVEKPDGKPFIFIIDEWDAVIREAGHDEEARKRFLNMLRGWFKNTNFTPKVVAAAYMTGILPIKKDGSQSAISEFDEFSMLDPLEFTEYVGFTESEVRERCSGAGVSFEEMKAWYDGYSFPSMGLSIYNPYSVMNALKTGKCRSYWRKTSATESLRNYISMDFKGLQETVVRLIAGEEIPVAVEGFQNDLESFENADDVLTLLVHLGYLSYQEEEGTVRIPNEEVRIEFRQFLSQKQVNPVWIALINRSEKLLEDTFKGCEKEVAAGLELIRREQYAPQFYNNEQALRAVIKYAYFAASGRYIKIEEMPSGKGIADVVFIPMPMTSTPAMVIELKWNKSSGGAIAQIKKKNYIEVLKPFLGNLLLVGMNYDEKTGKHSCKIEKV